MLKNRRDRLLFTAVLGVAGFASSSRFASADPTWFTAVDTHAETLGPLDVDDAGVIRHGISEAGNIGLRLVAGGGDQPAVYTASTGVTTLIQSVGAGSVTPQGTDSPVRAMSTNGLAAGYFKTPSNNAYVYNPGAPFGVSPTPGYDTGFDNITPRTTAGLSSGTFGRANGINGLGRVIGDGVGTRLYFPQDTPAGEFLAGGSGSYTGGTTLTIANLTSNNLDDRTEIVGQGPAGTVRPTGYATRQPAFQIWFPNSQAGRWATSDTGTLGTVGTVTPEAINTVYFPGTGPTARTFVAGTDNTNGRDIANSGDVAGYGPDPALGKTSAFDRGFVYRRSSKTFAFANPLGTDATSELIGVNNGAIAVGVSDSDAPFNAGSGGANPSKGIIFNQSFGSAPVDLNRVTAGIPTGYNIFDAFGISSYNGDGTHKFYIAVYASTGANGTGTIKALLLKSSMGDFVGGGNGVNAADINALNANMGGVANTYDLTGDNVVDTHDRDMLVEGVLNTEYGDANLDDVINTSDFVTMAANFNTSGAGWAKGDFNGDGIVNALDFNAIASNFGYDNSVPAVPSLSQPALGALVPEPTTAAIVSLAALLIRRRRASRTLSI